MEEANLLPVLPMRGVLVFPYLVVPLEVGRERSLAALEVAMLGERKIVLVSQKNPRDDEPGPDGLYAYGVIAEVKQVLKMPHGTTKVVVEGQTRARLARLLSEPTYFAGEVEPLPEPESLDPRPDDVEALMRAVADLFEAYVKNHKRIPAEATVSIAVDDPGRLADAIAATLELKTADKQDVLETLDPKARLERVHALLGHQVEIMDIERRINVRVRRQMDKSQREYYLREQLKAIRRELGDSEEGRPSEADEYRARLEKKKLPEAVQEKVTRELGRLDQMPPTVAEAVVVRNYLDWLLDLPWLEQTEDRLEVDVAEKMLDEDHYGLVRVKDRILEYMAVRQLSQSMRGPILCLVGPPGVGKTSLARSIARATNRHFVRVSLGGVRDEAEVRGHRRTYVGAMPGRILQGMRQAGSNNPVFLLDEIDKMAMDFRGDPSAALLEVLDPEQNKNFSDHYVELPFDLSSVMFVTTANLQHNIPHPLLDRMELIPIAGYTEEEKLQIGRRHLLPKVLPEHGLSDRDVDFGLPALQQVIRGYTREAGVRQLEREMGGVLRKVAREVVAGADRPVKVTRSRLRRYLGPARVRHTAAEAGDQVGVATGLGVTEVGGDIMPVEATVMSGKGHLTLTGQLGEVMQESGHADFAFIRAHAAALNIPEDFAERFDIHVHVPEGAVPKDGPSAGVTLATAMVSALSGRAVKGTVATPLAIRARTW